MSFLIIDGNSIAYRAAVAKNINGEELVNSKGIVTGGIFRFINMLNNVLKMIRPTHIIIGFDTSKDTFRHELYPLYKANRENHIDGLYTQFDDIKKFLDLLGIKHDNVLKFEGDDVVGTYLNISKAESNFILSGDKDIFQLINNNTKVIFPIKGVSKVEIFDKNKLLEKYGVSIKQYIDYKCLLGDGSDNIPGVPGFGQTSAVKLLQVHGSIDNALKNIDEKIKIRGWDRLKSNLLSWQEYYNISKQLVTIRKDVPIKYSFKECKTQLNWDNTMPLLEEFEFSTLITKVKEGKMYGQKNRLI